MKKVLFFIAAIFLLIGSAPAQTSRKGAPNAQELGRAVFSAFQENRFGSINNYLPTEAELRVLKRRSSEDMRLVLEKTSADSVKQNLLRNFNHISEQTTANAFNWTDWQLADTKATRRDRKNPLLYSLELTLTNATGIQHYIVAEGLRIRGRFYLFKQLVFRSNK